MEECEFEMKKSSTAHNKLSLEKENIERKKQELNEVQIRQQVFIILVFFQSLWMSYFFPVFLRQSAIQASVGEYFWKTRASWKATNDKKGS